MATDQEIRDAGYKFISNQQYLQNPFELPTNQTGGTGNTGGITNTNVSTSYMGYPSYEAYLAAQRGGGGGGAGDEDDTTTTTGTFDWSNFPSLINIARKVGTWGIDKFGEWNEARKEKAKADAKKAAGYDEEGGWSSPTGRDHAGTGGIGSPESGKGGQPGTEGAGFSHADGGIVSLAQGGRAGYRFGRGVEQQTDFLEGPQENLMASDPGMGEGPFMLQEYLKAVNEGYKGSYDDFINDIDVNPSDFLAQGGLAGLL